MLSKDGFSGAVLAGLALAAIAGLIFYSPPPKYLARKSAGSFILSRPAIAYSCRMDVWGVKGFRIPKERTPLGDPPPEGIRASGELDPVVACPRIKNLPGWEISQRNYD